MKSDFTKNDHFSIKILQNNISNVFAGILGIIQRSDEPKVGQSRRRLSTLKEWN